jgi:hypothetical protein
MGSHQTSSQHFRRPQKCRLIAVRRAGLVIGASVTMALLLSACSIFSGPSQTGSGTKTPTPTGLSGSSSPEPTPSPTTTPTAGPQGFQVVFTENYTAAGCGGSYPLGTVCVTSSGSGQESELGTISLQRTSIYAPGGPDSCGPATTKGTLTLASGDSITFTGTGTFCRATQSANFTYKITGGSGTYLHATGGGTIQVPLPTSSSTGTETWAGTLQT